MQGINAQYDHMAAAANEYTDSWLGQEIYVSFFHSSCMTEPELETMVQVGDDIWELKNPHSKFAGNQYHSLSDGDTIYWS